MIKELIELMKTYDDARQDLMKDHVNQVAAIKKEYAAGGETYNRLMEESNNLLEGGVKALTDKLNEKIDSCFESANTAIKNYITKPMTTEELSAVTTLNMISGEISKTEADIFFDAAKGNYGAKMAVTPVVKRITGEEKHFMRYDEVKAQLDEVENDIRDWVKNFNPGSYSHAVMISDGVNAITAAETLIESFIHGAA